MNSTLEDYITTSSGPLSSPLQHLQRAGTAQHFGVHCDLDTLSLNCRVVEADSLMLQVDTERWEYNGALCKAHWSMWGIPLTSLALDQALDEHIIATSFALASIVLSSLLWDTKFCLFVKKITIELYMCNYSFEISQRLKKLYHYSKVLVVHISTPLAHIHNIVV